MTEPTHYRSDFGARQLALLVAATVLLVFVWTYIG
jgi:hypothetical protein